MNAITRRSLLQAGPLLAQAGIQAAPARSKRDLMQAVLNMEAKPGYVPAAFFMHFGVKGDAAVKAHLDHFRSTGQDFVKIQLDEQGLRAPVPIKTPDDWRKFPVLTEKWWEPTLYLAKALVQEAKSEGLIIQTLFSPYQMAKQAVPSKVLIEHARQDPEAVCRGMENILLSILNMVQATRRLGVDGFYMCTQGGESNHFGDSALFNRVVKAYDMLLYKATMELAPYNITHICDYEGSYADFDARFRDYPGQVINVPLEAEGKPLTLRRAAELFQRPVMGGLKRTGAIAKGTPDEVRKAVVEVLQDAPANVILGADCTVSLKTARENLQMAIRTAHEFRA